MINSCWTAKSVNWKCKRVEWPVVWPKRQSYLQAALRSIRSVALRVIWLISLFISRNYKALSHWDLIRIAFLALHRPCGWLPGKHWRVLSTSKSMHIERKSQWYDHEPTLQKTQGAAIQEPDQRSSNHHASCKSHHTEWSMLTAPNYHNHHCSTKWQQERVFATQIQSMFSDINRSNCFDNRSGCLHDRQTIWTSKVLITCLNEHPTDGEQSNARSDLNDKCR